MTFFLPSYKKANLEMNKEGLAADLVCLLDERSKPRNSAKFQEQIERFFIAGAARIDLIAKVMDLDNEIGGHNFDIPNLEETANEIESLGNSGGKDLCDYTSHPCYLFFITMIFAPMIARRVVHMQKDMFGYTFWPKCPIKLSLKATSLHAFPVDDPLSLNKQENEY